MLVRAAKPAYAPRYRRPKQSDALGHPSFRQCSERAKALGRTHRSTLSGRVFRSEHSPREKLLDHLARSGSLRAVRIADRRAGMGHLAHPRSRARPSRCPLCPLRCRGPLGDGARKRLGRAHAATSRHTSHQVQDLTLPARHSAVRCARPPLPAPSRPDPGAARGTSTSDAVRSTS